MYIYILSKPNVLTLHTTHTHHTHPPPPPPAQPACQRGGGVVSYRAFRKKMGGLVRDPGRAFYLDICRMKWPSFFKAKTVSKPIKSSKTAIRRGSCEGSQLPAAVSFESGPLFTMLTHSERGQTM